VKEAALLELLDRLAEAGPSRELWRALLDNLAQEIGCERVFAFRLRAGGGFRIVCARSHDREDVPEPEGRVSHYAVQKMAASGRPVFVADSRRDRRYKTEEALQGRRTAMSLLVLPLKARGEVRGGVYADHRFHALERPPESAGRLGALVSIAALALELTERGKSTAEGRRADRPEPPVEVGDGQEGGGAGATEIPGSPPPDSIQWFEGLLSANPDVCDVFDTLRSLAGADLPILICGETGTGKSALAHAIHSASSRRQGPFVTVSCGAVPEELIESELLGHVKGAFTGADTDREGVFVQAHRGTLLLDEAAEMSPALQRKLLRVLEDGRVRALGAKGPIQVDVRILASTTRSLERLVREGRFRRDLYFRLKSLEIELLPLRDRREDILPLAGHFLEVYAREASRPTPQLDPRAASALLGHLWPGNVREVANEMRRIVALGRTVVQPEDLLLAGKHRTAAARLRARGEGGGSLAEQVEAAERGAVLEALRMARGNKSKAASSLEITRKSLYRRLERYGIGGREDDW